MSVGQDNFKNILPVTRGLNGRNLSAATVCNPCFGDLVIVDSVIDVDIGLADDAGNAKLAQFGVNLNLLSTSDNEIPIWQKLDNQRGDPQTD